MGEKTQKKSWFKGLSTEFKKVIWPDRKDLARQTAVVIVATVILGAVIALVDFILGYGINVLINLG